MTISKDRVEMEARLQVIETMLAKLWATNLLFTFPDPHAAADQLIANYRDLLSKETYGDDPVLSDLVASEIEHAFFEFLTTVKEKLPPKTKD